MTNPKDTIEALNPIIKEMEDVILDLTGHGEPPYGDTKANFYDLADEAMVKIEPSLKGHMICIVCGRLDFEHYNNCPIDHIEKLAEKIALERENE